MRERILQVSKEIGIPTKKVYDFLYQLREGDPVENNELVQRLGMSRNVLNQVKKLFSSFLEPISQNTQLKGDAVEEIQSLFGSNYKPEETAWVFLEDEDYRQALKLLEKYKDKRPSPERKYDQFTATIETTARRVSLMSHFEDIRGKRLLFLGDDDFTSIAVANFHQTSDITVLDIDDRILDNINSISKAEGFEILLGNYDARKLLPISYSGRFDVVFTDPPYTTDGIKLFVSRAIQALDLSNQSARIYICYGNSDRAKERFLPIYELFESSGLMVRWTFDKFNRYHGAESIGSSSSLFVLDATSKTKPLIAANYDKPIYTND